MTLHWQFFFCCGDKLEAPRRIVTCLTGDCPDRGWQKTRSEKSGPEIWPCAGLRYDANESGWGRRFRHSSIRIQLELKLQIEAIMSPKTMNRSASDSGPRIIGVGTFTASKR